MAEEKGSEWNKLRVKLVAEDTKPGFQLHFRNMARKPEADRESEAGWLKPDESRTLENKPGVFSIQIRRESKSLEKHLDLTITNDSGVIVKAVRDKEYNVFYRMDEMGAPFSSLGSVSLKDWD